MGCALDTTSYSYFSRTIAVWPIMTSNARLYGKGSFRKMVCRTENSWRVNPILPPPFLELRTVYHVQLTCLVGHTFIYRVIGLVISGCLSPSTPLATAYEQLVGLPITYLPTFGKCTCIGYIPELLCQAILVYVGKPLAFVVLSLLINSAYVLDNK